jgi:hypothetical protein
VIDARKSRVCVVDAHGEDVFMGDYVTDSMCEEHRVAAIKPILGTNCAWIVDDSGTLLVPHLTELLKRGGGM